MDAVPIASFHLPSEAATERLAAGLAPLLGPGDTLLLEGPIGAGKTFFARALIQARLAAAHRWEEVPSPTYTLVQTYADGVVEIWNVDLYRLSGPGEIAELGLEDAFDTAICLVEWPDRLGVSAPPGALTLRFVTDGDPQARRIEAWSNEPRWATRLAEVTAETGNRRVG